MRCRKTASARLLAGVQAYQQEPGGTGGHRKAVGAVQRDHAPGFSEATADAERGVELMYDERGREIRLLEVDAAAAARHDPDVAAGLASLYGDRHVRIRDAMSAAHDPDTAAWLVGVVTAGIGMKESTGPPPPDSERVRATLLAVVRGV